MHSLVNKNFDDIKMRGTNVKISQLWLKSMKCESYNSLCITQKERNLQLRSSKMELMGCVTDNRGEAKASEDSQLK